VSRVRQEEHQKVWRGVKTIRWDDATLELIKATTQTLIDEGLLRPSIRQVLYRMLKTQVGWSKTRYGTLTKRLGRWRDRQEFPFGIFSDDAGARVRTYTPTEIEQQRTRWQNVEPATLSKDGWLRALLVEQETLVPQLDHWCDGRALIVSSAGQIRRENLWTATQEWKGMAAELGAKGIRVYALVDRDHGGNTIYESHRRWFEKVAGLDLEFFGLTDAQLEHVGLATDEDWQIDGAIALDPRWWRRQIRRLLLGRA
jgi:hypothetical protein